jgi:hypothetical protein
MSTNETQINEGKYEVNIDFDEASREWNANKKKSANGYMIRKMVNLANVQKNIELNILKFYLKNF